MKLSAIPLTQCQNGELDVDWAADAVVFNREWQKDEGERVSQTFVREQGSGSDKTMTSFVGLWGALH